MIQLFTPFTEKSNWMIKLGVTKIKAPCVCMIDVPKYDPDYESQKIKLVLLIHPN